MSEKTLKSPFQLDKATVGMTYKLLSYNDMTLASKMMAMGVLPGNEVRVVQKLWKGSNLFIECNAQQIALRREEAATILVTKE